MNPDDFEDDKTYWCISPCLGCPECGSQELYRCPEIEGIEEVSCWDCGALWYERAWDEDEEDDL